VLASKESVSACVVDESFLYRQKPMYGYAVYGDSVYGGRERLRAGDSVPVISRKAFGDSAERLKRIVAITRHRNDPGIDLVFDAFRYDRPTQLQQTNERLMLMLRSWMERANSVPVRLEFGGAATSAWAVRLFGIIERVLLTVRSASWGATTLSVLEIGGVDVTAALGGPWTADFTVDVTTYLPRAGDYTLEFTTNGAVNLDCQLTTRLLG